jgi:EamA domain-containing membrane protein RarD
MRTSGAAYHYTDKYREVSNLRELQPLNADLKLVVGMSFLRFLSGTIELIAALLMLSSMNLNVAMRINGLLGFVGPTILILVSALGLVGLAGQVSLHKLTFIITGVICILVGTRS